MEPNKELDDLLSKVDPEKRDLLKKAVIGTAFAIPVILSFGMEDVKAQALTSKSRLPAVSPVQ